MNIAHFAGTLAGMRQIRYTAVISLLAAVTASLGLSSEAVQAQQWRGRFFSRVQYVEAQPLIQDSVPIGQTTGTGRRRLFGQTSVSCEPSATQCFYYRSASVVSTAPVVQDMDLNVWGFGVEGLRVYANTRLRTALGDEEFWPRSQDHFDLINGYVELRRQRYRARLGRDYEISGLGYYGYDGASVEVRLGTTSPVEFKAYGGWGLERGIPETVTSGALASLEEFQPRERNLLLGFRVAARPAAGVSLAAIYQREVDTDWSDIASERVGFDAAYYPATAVSLRGNADFDMATGWFGKAGATAAWSPLSQLYVEGRVFRYRPVFSLQTIWAAFTPVPYTGWGATVGIQPRSDLAVRLEGERRDYADTDADVFFQVTTDRTWRAGASASWQPTEMWDIQTGYWLNFSPGSALNAGNLRVNVSPTADLTLGAALSAFQQLGEFRVGEGRVWSVGSNIQWETTLGTVWGSIDRYQHDRRSPDMAQLDWTQTRASFGLAFYVGSEPGRMR